MDIKRESIFVSSVRAFCNTFSVMIGVIVTIVIFVTILIVILKPPMTSEKTTLIIGADAEGNRNLLPANTPVIFRINCHGIIGSKELNSKTIEAQLLDSREGIFKNNRVKAIYLHINSPGGTVTDSYNIYHQLVEYKKKHKTPIYAYVDGMCASGGMMIACSADKILSNPVSMIGSVGVRIGPFFNIAGLMETYGVKQLTLTKGKDKDMLSPYRDWVPGEDKSLKQMMAYNYNQFIDIVTKARPRLDRYKLINEYGAQVYDPIKAQDYGYIDEGNSSYSTSLTELVQIAGIKDNEKYQVIELKVIFPVLSNLIEGTSPIFTGKIKHQLDIPSDFPPELLNRSLYLYSPALYMYKTD